MGLVEYSDSESDGEPPPTTALQGAAVATQPVKKQSFQKLIDKSNPNKILVSLPSVPATPDETANSEAPAAKRLKTGGGRFSGFSSFLPPPKATSGGPLGGGSGKPAPRVGVNLKTSSEAAFSRDGDGGGGDGLSRTDHQASLSNSPSAAATVPAQPVIPAGQKSEGDVKLVGKPLMFKPLSVARKPGKKAGGPKTTSAASTTASTTASHGSTPNPHSAAVDSETAKRGDEPAVAQIKKKVSLFSVVDDTQSTGPVHEDSSTYGAGPPSYDVAPGRNALGDHASQQQYSGARHPPVQEAGYPEPTSLGSIADDLNLDAAARRELFGRGGAPTRATAKSVINFNLDQEYRHNEELRQSGALDQKQHNPLRAIKPGKHSLQQLVNQVQSQRDALEENFAKNRATQKQSGAKYGF